MAKCDLCGAAASIGDMQPLRDCYQIEGVIDLCPVCMKWANAELNSIRLANTPEMRRRIAERAGKSWPPSLWARLKYWLGITGPSV